MPSRQDKLAAKKLSPEAEAHAKDVFDEFTSNLVLQAKTLAHIRREELVLTNHIKEAQDIISKRMKEKWWHESLILLGGILIGIFAQGLLTELSNNIFRPTLILTYVMFGIVGMLSVGGGLFFKYKI